MKFSYGNIVLALSEGRWVNATYVREDAIFVYVRDDKTDKILKVREIQGLNI